MPYSAEAVSDILPPWVPTEPPGEWTLDDVFKHVKTGVMIELTTIPLYLYASYSIKPDDEGTGVRDKIREVFLQEMLHLALLGNILSALDGSVDLYDFSIIPSFPGKILFEQVDMNLDRANQQNLELFKRLEAPYAPPISIRGAPLDVIPEYHSIGEFYEQLQLGLLSLPDDAFKNNPTLQFSPSDFGFHGDMAIITSRSIAEEKLKLVIEQGEGGPDQPDSHFAIFSTLSLQPPTWNLTDVRKNPKTRDYKDLGDPKDFAYKLSLAFDAAYCYLLQNIQRVWGKEEGGAKLHKQLITNIRLLMILVLTPIADMLVGQGLTSDTDFAAPCFNYYPLDNDGNPLTPLEPDALHPALVKLVGDAAAIAPNDGMRGELEGIAGSINTIMPPHPKSV